jgi:hypothetical protein
MKLDQFLVPSSSWRARPDFLPTMFAFGDWRSEEIEDAGTEFCSCRVTDSASRPCVFCPINGKKE